MNSDQDRVAFRDFLTPISVIIGSIIISVTLLYGGNFLTLKTGSGGTVNPVAAAIKITDRADAPRMGGGKVEVVVFSDFQCPFCQQFFNTAYKDIKTNYVDTNKIKFIFRHFPLTSIHKNAEIAAEAGECANQQGKFFQYHDELFVNAKSDGTNLDLASLKKYAQSLGLDTARFNQCLDGGETKSIVAKDLAEGTKDGVTGTPTIFINGIKIVGSQPYATFQQAIDTALSK